MPISFIHKQFSRFLPIIPLIFVVILLVIGYVLFQQFQSESTTLQSSLSESAKKLAATEKELQNLKNQDQVKRNDSLEKDIKAIETTYTQAVKAYEEIQDLKVQKQNTVALEELLVTSLSQLSERNYTSATASLTTLNTQITKAKTPVITAPQTPALANAPVNNTPPSSGYNLQKVQTEIGEYTVGIVSADLNSTRVIVDTASDGDCRDNCPVLPLGTYVARNGAFAGINGSYFCPASYPSCAGKTNTFDTLLMNKNKVYFNADNNVYSNVPVAVFGSGFARFIGQSSGWGRDTGVDGVIANQPLLLSGGNIAFGGDGDPKKGSKGARSFVGNKGSTVYIGVVYNATVAEAAYALKGLGLENALNLDSGGSTALWSGGYKAGPGRDIPNAILFVGR